MFLVMSNLNAFGFVPSSWDKPIDFSCVPSAPDMIDGAEIIETISPVSKLTGHRTNPLTLLGAVTDGNARLLQAVLAELPTVQEMDASDEDKLDMLVSRLDTGTFADLDKVRDALGSIADVMFKQTGEKVVKPDVIQFEQSDVTPSSDAQ